MEDFSLEGLPIWVVNLKRSTARKTYIEGHLRSLGLTYEIIEAVDGRDLSDEEILRCEKEAEGSRMFHIVRDLATSEPPIRKAQMGCSLSHRKCWQRMVDECMDEVLILEDDVVLTQDFVEVIKRRRLFPAHWERINFRTWPASFPFGKPLYRHYQLAKYANADYGTVCYFLKRSGAKKLLEQNFTAYLPVDIHTGSDFISGCISGGIHPLPVFLLDVESDIGYSPRMESDAQKPNRWMLILTKLAIGILAWLELPPSPKRRFMYDYYQKKIVKRKAKQDIRHILKHHSWEA